MPRPGSHRWQAPAAHLYPGQIGIDPAAGKITSDTVEDMAGLREPQSCPCRCRHRPHARRQDHLLPRGHGRLRRIQRGLRTPLQGSPPASAAAKALLAQALSGEIEVIYEVKSYAIPVSILSRFF